MATANLQNIITFASSPEQSKRLRLAAAEKDLPMSEIIRRSVDEYLGKSA